MFLGWETPIDEEIGGERSTERKEKGGGNENRKLENQA